MQQYLMEQQHKPYADLAENYLQMLNMKLELLFV